jgi:hypothetical protein
VNDQLVGVGEDPREIVVIREYHSPARTRIRTFRIQVKLIELSLLFGQSERNDVFQFGQQCILQNIEIATLKIKEVKATNNIPYINNSLQFGVQNMATEK